MGVLPLTFKDGESHEQLGLTGHEAFSIPLSDDVQPLQWVTVTADRGDGTSTTFEAQVRLDTPVELNTTATAASCTRFSVRWLNPPHESSRLKIK